MQAGVLRHFATLQVKKVYQNGLKRGQTTEGHLEPVVDGVVDDEHERAHSNHVVGPRERHERDGGGVVDQILQEILFKKRNRSVTH